MEVDHDHGLGDGSRQPLTEKTVRRALVAAVGAVALATAIGLLVLWPREEVPAPPEAFDTGEIIDATVTATRLDERPEGRYLVVEIEATSGTPEGETGSFEIAVDATPGPAPDFAAGDSLLVSWFPDRPPEQSFFFEDYQRRTSMLWLVAIFVVAVLLLGRWKGLRALAGLVVTGIVLVAFMFPALLLGESPVAVSLVAAGVIALVALFLTHGVNERTAVALLGALGALGLTAVLALIFTEAARFTGFGSEDAIVLSVASGEVDVRGLVLAGIIIGSLGVLDDVTVTQVAAVWQLRRADPTYGFVDLYRSAVSIGRDHIASTVNTLVLAYAGAALPLLLFYAQTARPLSEVAVREIVAVEIVRTLVGSIGLVAAVPITTAVAAVVVTARPLPHGQHARSSP